MGRLSGKVAVITGATSGIGRGVARRFVREGAKVFVAARGEEAGRETEAELQSLKKNAFARFIPADLANREAITGVIREARDVFGRIDILINNGQGIPPVRSILNKMDDDYHYSLTTGFFATKWMMQEVVPVMKARGGGSIVNVASAYGIVSPPNVSDYSATKEAIRAITRNAANEWGRFNIRVNVVCPAAVSAGLLNWKKANPEYARISEMQIPLQRYGDPEHDLGNLFLGLVSDETCFITGQTFGGDGGNVFLRRKASATDVEGVAYQNDKN